MKNWSPRSVHGTCCSKQIRISSSEVKTQAYQSYVRPRLEYAASVWDPFTKTNKDKLEMVQRYNARWTLGQYHNRSIVTDMLNHLGWRSLEMRRVDACMSMMYKMSNGLVKGLVMDRCVLLASTPEWVVSPCRAITRVQPEWSPQGETTHEGH